MSYQAPTRICPGCQMPTTEWDGYRCNCDKWRRSRAQLAPAPEGEASPRDSDVASAPEDGKGEALGSLYPDEVIMAFELASALEVLMGTLDPWNPTERHLMAGLLAARLRARLT